MGNKWKEFENLFGFRFFLSFLCHLLLISSDVKKKEIKGERRDDLLPDWVEEGASLGLVWFGFLVSLIFSLLFFC